jgi:hypothetical protein
MATCSPIYAVPIDTVSAKGAGNRLGYISAAVIVPNVATPTKMSSFDSVPSLLPGTRLTRRALAIVKSELTKTFAQRT